ncbi:hypothetical protein GLOTRDRAFT_135876 [Gloeophyllum trabeum ATCC 11539]|uniref:Uncharacterized protein n=1 Tax=Gloeophyllum trabeum (strain ATCC 11539 / FP-39264 / Madison 617) TaxID=670483 RepID=S7RVM4_GLOTA|nr:uncharacterized protein GLOTRDRAFT_135876 [Gloeophyllum trabeum ATCC 11539]EPQ58855.1 hypothetical protein GLOTRDRAFT_135876 [Gloeophyllum trabeum ATCC 11539]
MPGPAVYAVVAVVGTVAAVVAFKEFVYEPHIAPKVEAWAESYLARRRARRRQRQGPALAQPYSADEGEAGPSHPRRSFELGKGSDADDRTSIELEKLVAKEVDEWRNGVERSQSELRQRHNRNASALDESNISIPFAPMSPTHVIFDTTTTSSSSRTSVGRTPSGTLTISDIDEGSVRGSEYQERVATPPTAVAPTIVYPRLPTPSSSRSSTPAVRSAMSRSAISVFESACSGSPSGSPSSSRSPSPPRQIVLSGSRPESPFSDLAAVAQARSAMTSPFSLPSDADDVLSLHSGLSSAAVSVHEDDVQSLDGSEDSSWASIGSPRHQ